MGKQKKKLDVIGQGQWSGVWTRFLLGYCCGELVKIIRAKVIRVELYYKFIETFSECAIKEKFFFTSLNHIVQQPIPMIFRTKNENFHVLW
jgi:hypothetical protein